MCQAKNYLFNNLIKKNTVTIFDEIEEERKKNKSLDIFMSVIKARRSKRSLYESLRVYLRWSKSKGYARTYDDLLKGTEDELEDKLRQYIQHLNPNSTRSVMAHRYYAIKTFYSLNKVRLNWDLIKRFKNPEKPDVEDRPYKKDEIERMLAWAKNHNDVELEFVIIIMASSGMRIGAITVDDTETALELDPNKPVPILKLGNLKWIEEHRLFALRVYAGHSEEYRGFMSSQAAECGQRYWAAVSKKYKLKMTRDSYVFYNKENPDLPVPANTFQQKLLECKKAVGIKGVWVKSSHGFRKYVETSAFVEAGLDPRKSRLLLGHRLEGQDDSYFKPSLEQLLVGTPDAKGYIYAKDALTFHY